MPVVAPQADSSIFPTELIEFSRHIEQSRERQLPLWPRNAGDGLVEGEYIGAQLFPLHQRDIEALRELFESQEVAEMEAIDQNVRATLQLLWPELCWEDDPFEVVDEFAFLSEFL